ncbi:helix-turn-helix transcriptional regulator [Kribbella kalugense]|uniref:Putative ArsR family transcriptional regulator n=1 Tax=Kribbella kalugense TaxID=2512221 RepID=A0A4R7ZZE7_9ACTN|nr:helix-turn-helix domain-containing protein [Kribbella kalugense]TDW23593.1 putative ArsR family transcriptional regulator [Kribbella kalugense]
MDSSWDARVQAVAVLEEPTRRRLYEYVVGRGDAVSRDEAATALGIPRTTAAFHLDKLTEEGLLDTCYERRSGRTGPGAGRPAKLYHRSDREIEITLPERQYAVAGHLLAAAIEDAETTSLSPREAVNRQAREYGATLGRDGGELTAILAANGFEPRPDGDGIALANCPFRRLAADYPRLVCGMNLNLLEGLLDSVDNTGLEARLDPQPQSCCVRLVSSEGG